MPIQLIHGVQLYWEQGGSGDPVILVHGSWGDHHNWDTVVPLLSKSFQVVTFDVATQQLTSRECLWNSRGAADGPMVPVAWGESHTVSIAPRAK